MRFSIRCKNVPFSFWSYFAQISSEVESMRGFLTVILINLNVIHSQNNNKYFYENFFPGDVSYWSCFAQISSMVKSMRGILTVCLINLKVVHSYNKNKYFFQKLFPLERTSHENIVFQNLVQILHTAWVLIPQYTLQALIEKLFYFIFSTRHLDINLLFTRR